MKKFIAILLMLLILLPAAALAGGANGSTDLPERVLSSLTTNTAFRDYDIVSWSEISDSGFIFVSLHKETRNRMVVYKYKDAEWAYSYYSDTAMPSGAECYIEDATGSMTMTDQRELEDAVIWYQLNESEEARKNVTCAELKKSKWYATSYSTEDESIAISSSSLSYYKDDLDFVGKAYGVYQNDLRYFSVHALPKTLSEAREKLSNPPKVPTGSFEVQNVKFTGREKYDVYSGPDWDYYRAANGKAAVSTNDWIQVFGHEGDWLLIQYAISGDQMRFGYIPYSALNNKGVDALSFSELSAYTYRSVALTNDPLGEKGTVMTLANGESITCLAEMGEWEYIECETGAGQLTRGFIPSNAVTVMNNMSGVTVNEKFSDYSARAEFTFIYSTNVSSGYVGANGLESIAIGVTIPYAKSDIVGYRLYYNNTMLCESQFSAAVATNKSIYMQGNVTAPSAGTVGLCPVYSDGSVKTDEMITVTLN